MVQQETPVRARRQPRRLSKSQARRPPLVVATTPRVAPGSRSPRLSAYIQILRPQNILPSALLVALGAWVSTHEVSTLLNYKVLLTELSSVLVAVGSCVLNDWFDLKLDSINKPERPLVTGEVKPAHALAMGLACLAGALASASVVNPATLQAVIAASVLLVTAYTPMLKPVPLLKNLVVAAIIATSIVAGGLAAGATFDGVAAPAIVTFFGIVHREILMDIADVQGDADTGVMTVPVLLGPPRALVAGVSLLTVGLANTLVQVLANASHPYIGAGLLLLFSGPLYLNAAKVALEGYREEAVSAAVNGAFVPLLLILALMGYLLH